MAPTEKTAEPDFQGLVGREFKEAIKGHLRGRLTSTVKSRAGESFDQRMAKAVDGFKKKARAVEAEQNKILSAAVDKGRSRPSSAPIRPRGGDPNQAKMLAERKKQMHEQEQDYAKQLEDLKDKMDRRNPLFKLEEVQQAFEMQKRRQKEHREFLQEEERQRWAHIRELEVSATKRPLLVEDPTYKAPPPERTESVPDLKASGIFIPGSGQFECDFRIAAAMSRRSFQESDWGKEVKRIQEKTDARQKLHEIEYPQKSDGRKFARQRLMHRLPANPRCAFR
eukprot:TRINITY_DN102249_c0_g1_i1.p1 TRINITY_DN102249_c0_g1~~TRINITY_DN102249_c0_g1_i1.p1  ORF type:complete len:281 (+),score=66.34 TRINITY_DN102249_c0_g1_i1:183-1025(+)